MGKEAFYISVTGYAVVSEMCCKEYVTVRKSPNVQFSVSLGKQTTIS